MSRIVWFVVFLSTVRTSQRGLSCRRSVYRHGRDRFAAAMPCCQGTRDEAVRAMLLVFVHCLGEVAVNV